MSCEIILLGFALLLSILGLILRIQADRLTKGVMLSNVWSAEYDKRIAKSFHYREIGEYSTTFSMCIVLGLIIRRIMELGGK